MIVITGRVIPRRETIRSPAIPYVRCHFRLQVGQVLLVCRPSLLLLGGQTVQTYILFSTRTGFIAESNHRTGGTRHETPDGRLYLVLVVICDRQTMLKRFLSVSQDILADITEVDVQLSVIVLRMIGVRMLGIHEPELDVLDIGFLEVGVVQTSHHTAPAVVGIDQLTVRTDFIRGDIIRTTFGGVISEVEDR